MYPGLRLLMLVVLTFCLLANVSGQLCTGSLGDPVVNITFGAGPNPGPPLSAANLQNYNYSSITCPNDGNYAIGNSSVACFNNSWHTATEDHTPNDVNGYMMIINSSEASGVFYVDTVRGLCGGTTYEFAAWILNILKSSACGFNGRKPNVTFAIETISGTNLLTYETGDIDNIGQPLWQQYGAFFTLPAGINSLVIRMTNNASGGCGNDIILDDITFRPCGAKAVSSFTTAADPRELCLGDNSLVPMKADVTPSDANTAYQWQLSTNSGASWNDINGATTTTYTRPPGAGTSAGFLYRLAVAQGNNISLPTCRVVSNVITVNVNPFPVPAATNDGPKCEGDLLTLSASDGQSFTWSGPNGYTSNKQMAPLSPLRLMDAGKYFVSVTSAKGCTSFDSTVVTVNTRVTATAGSDVTICEGSSVTLQGGTGVSYSWLPATGLSATDIAMPVASPSDTTNYVLTVFNGQCTATDSVRVNVLKKPSANAGPDQRILQGQSVVLNGTRGGSSVSSFWTPPLFIDNARSLQPLVTPPVDTTYTLHVVSDNGCGSATDQVFVRVFKALKIPNVFSPNGDGINDVWKIEALDTYAEASLYVFDRYGRLLYTASGTNAAWNGTYKSKPLPVATYYYVIDLKNGMEKVSGSVLILR